VPGGFGGSQTGSGLMAGGDAADIERALPVFDALRPAGDRADVSVARVVAASHPTAAEATDRVQKYVSYGASPRAAIGIAEAARGVALISGRPTVGFEDVKAVAAPVLNHRLILNYQARLDRIGRDPEAGLDRK